METAWKGSDAAEDRASPGGTVNRPEHSHQILDHTSEMILRLTAPDFRGLLEEAAAAFRELIPGGASSAVAPGGDDPDGWRETTLHGTDRGTLLVEWLNELAFLAESEPWLPTMVESVEAVDGDAAEEQGDTRERPAREGEVPGALKAPRMVVRSRGTRLARPFVLVKAATLHNLIYLEGPDGIEAEVTLDI
jgi:SHS2 domain-containing protein